MLNGAAVRLKNFCLFLCAAALAMGVGAAVPTDAVAGNGNGKESNGNGGGNGNGNGNSGGNGNGGTASELRGANAAHSSARAQAVAAASSMPAKLNAYRDNYRGYMAASQVYRATEAEVARLQAMTPEQIAAAFPQGGYEQAVTQAQAGFSAARDEVMAYQTATAASLSTLNDGRTLSPQAMQDLHAMLGL